MRELKFRAWNNNDKRYRYSFNMNDCCKVIECVDGEKVYMPYVVEQYTGLKDKNGKEIYEGDIVKFDYGDQTPAEIIYEEGSYFLKATDDGSLFYDPDTDKPCPMGWFGTWGLEVIGNIHENKELSK